MTLKLVCKIIYTCLGKTAQKQEIHQSRIQSQDVDEFCIWQGKSRVLLIFFFLEECFIITLRDGKILPTASLPKDPNGP